MGLSSAQKKQRDKIAGPDDITVAEFAERFFKDIQERDRKNSAMPRRYLEKDILPHIGKKPIKEITAKDVRSVIARTACATQKSNRPSKSPVVSFHS